MTASMPDTTGWTHEELAALQAHVSQELAKRVNAEEAMRSQLLDPVAVKQEIDDMMAMIRDLDAWIATAPAGVTKQLSIALSRTAKNTVRLMRVTARILDSARVT